LFLSWWGPMRTALQSLEGGRVGGKIRGRRFGD
jgi:hypothetical protein